MKTIKKFNEKQSKISDTSGTPIEWRCETLYG